MYELLIQSLFFFSLLLTHTEFDLFQSMSVPHG